MNPTDPEHWDQRVDYVERGDPVDTEERRDLETEAWEARRSRRRRPRRTAYSAGRRSVFGGDQ